MAGLGNGWLKLLIIVQVLFEILHSVRIKTKTKTEFKKLVIYIHIVRWVEVIVATVKIILFHVNRLDLLNIIL